MDRKELTQGDASLTEKRVDGEILFKGRVVTLRRDRVLLPNGHTSTREVIDHPGGVAVAALDDEDNVYFVRQFRYPYEQVLLEIPAGKREPGEDPLECGKRELSEETGLTAAEFGSLGEDLPSVGYTAEVIWMFWAKGLTRGACNPDDDEFLNVVRIPLEEAVRMAADNEIRDSKTVMALFRLWKMRQDGKI